MEMQVSRSEFLKGFFGDKDRLDILSVIAAKETDPPQKFDMRGIYDELSEFTDIDLGVTHTEVRKLESFGMIQRVEHDNPSHISYVRIDSPAWTIVETAISAVDELFQSPPD